MSDTEALRAKLAEAERRAALAERRIQWCLTIVESNPVSFHHVGPRIRKLLTAQV